MNHLTLEQLALLADGAPGQDTARAHVERCAQCAQGLERMERVVMDMAHAPAVAPDFQKLRAPSRTPLYFSGAVLGAAVVMLLAWPPGGRKGALPEPRGAQAGGMAAQLMVEQAGAVRQLSPGEVVAPGPLRVSASVSAPSLAAGAWVGVFIRDAQGRVHWVWPAWPAGTSAPTLVHLGSAGIHAAVDGVQVDALPAGPLTVGLLSASNPCALSVVDADLEAQRPLTCGHLESTWTALAKER